MKNIEYQKLNNQELEKQKLVSEVRDFNRPFLIRNFSSITILFLTVASLSIGFYTGLFDAKRENLKLDINRFANQKKAIEDSIVTIKQVLDEYNEEMSDLEEENAVAAENEKKAKGELEKIINENSGLSKDFENIKNQNIADNQKIVELENLINKYEENSEQNIVRITTLNKNLQDKSELCNRLNDLQINNIGKIEVLNNSIESNFDRIIGTVLDDNNQPINEASILLKERTHGSYDKETNPIGEFSIKFLHDKQNQGRTFTIVVSKDGYETINGYVVVGSTIRIKLKKVSNNV